MIFLKEIPLFCFGVLCMIDIGMATKLELWSLLIFIVLAQSMY